MGDDNKRACLVCRKMITINANGSLRKHQCFGTPTGDAENASETAEQNVLADQFTRPTQVQATPDPEGSVSGQPEPDRDGYGRYLVKDPATGDYKRSRGGKPQGFTRATTFAKTAADTYAIARYDERLTLRGATLRPDIVALAHGMDVRNNRDELDKLVIQIKEAAGSKVASNLGTAVHSFTERVDAGLMELDDVPPAYRMHVESYQRALVENGLAVVPGLIERTTYIREYGGIAGTMDRVYEILADGSYVIGDVKTGRDLSYGWAEIEVQEWIYAHGINQSGVFDWITKSWQTPWENEETDPEERKRIQVREDIGLVVHIPVQSGGKDVHRNDMAVGDCEVVVADLNRGRQSAELCGQVREWRALRPKPAPFTALPAPERNWAEEFSSASSKEALAALWNDAYAAGIPGELMSEFQKIGMSRLAHLSGVDGR